MIYKKRIMLLLGVALTTFDINTSLVYPGILTISRLLNNTKMPKGTKRKFLASLLKDCINQPKVDVFFPDKESLAKHLTQLIDQEEKEIAFALYSCTHPEIIDRLMSAHKRGVKVWGVVDKTTEEQSVNLKNKETCEIMQQFLNKRWVEIYDRSYCKMHHKLWAFRCNKVLRQPITVTGSANATLSGLDSTCNRSVEAPCTRNCENLTIIRGDHEMFKKILKEIEYNFNQAKK